MFVLTLLKRCYVYLNVLYTANLRHFIKSDFVLPFQIFLNSRPFYLELKGVVRYTEGVSGYLSNQFQRNSGT